MLVLDSDSHPLLEPLLERDKKLLGYLSLGEVAHYRDYFALVRDQGLLIRENSNWPGAHFVDVRDERWSALVIERIIPGILRRGFQGLFLDTLDNPPYLEESDPIRFAGMRQAAIDLVAAIRRHYPYLKIMVNRGYALLPEIAGGIQAVLAESLDSQYDFATRTYRSTTPAERDQALKTLAEVRKRHPHLELYALNYWRPDDPEGIRRLYRLARERGFLPYVATVELDRILPEPD
ncbi:MAG: endo alpha-1,4 polygalactosaminidase [Magnetococcales bacterium]|nr:endo alpha-1,4 polygalactosaminidase [Magnetococcales bacterium]